MSHYRDPEWEAFYRPRWSEQKLAIVLAVITLLVIVALCLHPGASPEPGYPPSHTGAHAGTQGP